MELKAAEVLLRRRIRRLAEEGRKVPHIANVIPLGVFAEPALMSLIMRCRNGLMGLLHIESYCLAWG
jgi:hypothetical protein